MPEPAFESPELPAQLPDALGPSNANLMFSMVGNQLPQHALAFEALDGTTIIMNNSFYGELTRGGYRDGLAGMDALQAFLQDFGEQAQKILQEPHGASSIDRESETDAGQWARIAHVLRDGALVELAGGPIAVKTTGMNMELARRHLGGARGDLTGQFYKLLEAARLQQERAPEGIDGRLFVNEPYALIRHPDSNGEAREWLLSPYIDGESVEDQQLVLVGPGGSTVAAFDPQAYPELARIHTTNQYDPVLFSDFAVTLAYRLGYDHPQLSPVRDLHGGNILEQHSATGPTYTLIDL